MAAIESMLQRIDWKEVREWLSPAIAFVSVCWAIRESRAKRREAAGRADDAKKYTQALETVIRYGNFVQHLEGVDRRIGNVADQLTTIAAKTVSIAELAERQTGDALESFAKTAKAATELAEQLLIIGRTALRAQRDSFRAHATLVKTIEPKEPRISVGLENLEHHRELRAKLLALLRQLQTQTDTIRVRQVMTEVGITYGLDKVLEELQAMQRDGLIALSKPIGKSSTIELL